MRPSISIVAFAAERPLSPRGERALVVAEAAAQIADVELINPVRGEALRRRARPVTRVASPLMLDCWEPEAHWTLRRRGSAPDAALLVGFPFSPVYWAARWLVPRKIPYVVDLGDPWALTIPPGERPAMGRWRAARCEWFVWRFASAGVVTTALQAAALRKVFPSLPIVVRPNGFRSVPAPAAPAAWPSSRTLRLAHYGNLYGSRLPIGPLLSGLAASGRWEHVVFTQYGEDWTGALKGVSPGVRVNTHPPLPWEKVVASASEHDLAVVVGNRNPAQLPSKAVQYLTLPLARLAVVGEDPSDALTEYVRDKPGWMTVPWDAPADVASRAIAAHAARAWTRRQLAPPAAESWAEVAATLLDVVRVHALGEPTQRWEGQTPAPAIAAATSSQPR